MSAARIDHVAASREHLEGVYAQDDRSLIATAQAHATLALVEQQRIANVLTMATMPYTTAESLDRFPKVRDEIREALGLS